MQLYYHFFMTCQRSLPLSPERTLQSATLFSCHSLQLNPSHFPLHSNLGWMGAQKPGRPKLFVRNSDPRTSGYHLSHSTQLTILRSMTQQVQGDHGLLTERSCSLSTPSQLLFLWVEKATEDLSFLSIFFVEISSSRFKGDSCRHFAFAVRQAWKTTLRGDLCGLFSILFTRPRPEPADTFIFVSVHWFQTNVFWSSENKRSPVSRSFQIATPVGMPLYDSWFNCLWLNQRREIRSAVTQK